MTMLTRREWHALVAAGLVAGAAGRRPRAQTGRAESRIAGRGGPSLFRLLPPGARGVNAEGGRA